MSWVGPYSKGYCFGCKREEVLVAKRSLTLPTGDKATSQDPMCDDCYLKIEDAIANKTLETKE